MSKEKDLLARFGGNLAESMGAGRLPRAVAPAAPPAGDRHAGVTRLRAAAEIEVGRIAPDPHQPRVEFDADAIARLAESIKSHGQLQPIAVRWSEDMERYVIVTGERRWRAATLAGRPTVSAVILEGPRTESQILEMQLVENCLREDLQPIEQARAFRALMDRNGWPALRLAEVLHLNCGTVTRALALLDLPGAVQQRVEDGELAPSVAYEISKVEDPGAQAELAARVVAEGLSRAETVEAVRRASARPKGRGAGKGRKVTSRVMKTSAGPRVTVEFRKGLDDALVVESLRDALGQAEARRAEGDQAAA